MLIKNILIVSVLQSLGKRCDITTCIVTVKEFYCAVSLFYNHLPLSFGTCLRLMADARNACAMDKTPLKMFLFKG